jgi:cytochrome oxidase Cu insertion factor (SCO1/SenC/PrrC family)
MTCLRPLAALVALVAVLGGTLAPGSLPAQSRPIDDLMMDLNIAPLEPQPAPALAVTTMDGGRLTLADLKGQVVLVYFMATW